ncbi:hypothetical protein KKB18_08455, partial [bacterium]|nr:hypothetical protein [bacterium]
MTGKIIFWLLFGIAIVISLKLYTKYLEQKLVFIPDKVLELKPSEINPEWEDIYFNTDDGIEINGWFCPANPGDYT